MVKAPVGGRGGERDKVGAVSWKRPPWFRCMAESDLRGDDVLRLVEQQRESLAARPSGRRQGVTRSIIRVTAAVVLMGTSVTLGCNDAHTRNNSSAKP